MGSDIFFKTYTNKDIEEDTILNADIKPLLKDLSDEAMSAYVYVFTEMLNNAIEHSEADLIHIGINENKDKGKTYISTTIDDEGIGIFKKISDKLKLRNESEAILELAKGKFTTAPESHTGEGIFFSSKIADAFSIASGSNVYLTDETKKGYIMDWEAVGKGTTVAFDIDKNAKTAPSEIFNKFYTNPEEYGFDKTTIPVSLLGNEDETFVSRSAARRLLLRAEKFKSVILNFKGIKEIGRSFTDEIFRVFQNAHPDCEISAVNAAPEVRKMIEWAKNNTVS
jgi:anti-sigma regulatory factor (Ser/Thr protein kinase)/uncharacterized protein (UPF0297 family)